jgi:hypothetical protein
MRDIYKQIESYSKFNPSPLSIKKFIDFGEYLTHYEICSLSTKKKKRISNCPIINVNRKKSE